MEFIGMLVIGVSFLYQFPDRMNYNYLKIGIAFFSLGFLVEKFVLKD